MGLLVVTTVILIIRFLSRWFMQGNSIGWDDWMILVTWAGLVPSAFIVREMIHRGMGRDIWTVDPSGVTFMIKMFYVEQFIYQTVIVSTKISIVLLYLVSPTSRPSITFQFANNNFKRIFPNAVSKRFRYICWGVIAALVLYYVAFVIIFLVMSRPIVSCVMNQT